MYSIFVLLLGLSLVSQAASFSAVNMKRVLVTGGNKGIGKAICKKLLEDFDDVCVIIGSRNVQRGQAAVAELCNAVPGSEDRLTMVELDVVNDASVRAAAESVCGKDASHKLYGIVNNAGIGFGHGFEDTLQTNYMGVRRVCDAFATGVSRPGGRIVNIASASAPNFISRCSNPDLKGMLASPLTTTTIDRLDEIATSYKGQVDYEDTAYGVSKALLNAFTVLYAKENPELIINSCSPGWILTDLTAGMGATNAPEKGTVRYSTTMC
jgi:NAD(P)-dependent dehydrogenase (short-subunit alcohol dehydrogenase family)